MTNKNVFFDSGAFIALANIRDQHHATASEKLTALLKTSALFFTTSYIFSETMTRITRCVSIEKAIEIGEVIRKEGRITIINPAQEDIDDAWDVFKKYKDQNFSFVDCITFVIMIRMSIQRAFAFDNHFRTMKFVLI